jgi:hypothetical protein
MFNWFKRNKSKNSILNQWHIEGTSGFKIIKNPDSIQYVNDDASRVIYISALIIQGNDHSVVEPIISRPTIIEAANEWHIKGAKKSKNQILVCVISVKNDKDIEWAKSFIDAIQPNQISN